MDTTTSTKMSQRSSASRSPTARRKKRVSTTSKEMESNDHPRQQQQQQRSTNSGDTSNSPTARRKKPVSSKVHKHSSISPMVSASSTAKKSVTSAGGPLSSTRSTSSSVSNGKSITNKRAGQQQQQQQQQHPSKSPGLTTKATNTSTIKKNATTASRPASAKAEQRQQQRGKEEDHQPQIRRKSSKTSPTKKQQHFHYEDDNDYEDGQQQQHQHQKQQKQPQRQQQQQHPQPQKNLPRQEDRNLKEEENGAPRDMFDDFESELKDDESLSGDEDAFLSLEPGRPYRSSSGDSIYVGQRKNQSSSLKFTDTRANIVGRKKGTDIIWTIVVDTPGGHFDEPLTLVVGIEHDPLADIMDNDNSDNQTTDDPFEKLNRALKSQSLSEEDSHNEEDVSNNSNSYSHAKNTKEKIPIASEHEDIYNTGHADVARYSDEDTGSSEKHNNQQNENSQSSYRSDEGEGDDNGHKDNDAFHNSQNYVDYEDEYNDGANTRRDSGHNDYSDNEKSNNGSYDDDYDGQSRGSGEEDDDHSEEEEAEEIEETEHIDLEKSFTTVKSEDNSPRILPPHVLGSVLQKERKDSKELDDDKSQVSEQSLEMLQVFKPEQELQKQKSKNFGNHSRIGLANKPRRRKKNEIGNPNRMLQAGHSSADMATDVLNNNRPNKILHSGHLSADMGAEVLGKNRRQPKKRPTRRKTEDEKGLGKAAFHQSLDALPENSTFAKRQGGLQTTMHSAPNSGAASVDEDRAKKFAYHKSAAELTAEELGYEPDKHENPEQKMKFRGNQSLSGDLRRPRRPGGDKAISSNRSTGGDSSKPRRPVVKTRRGAPVPQVLPSMSQDTSSSDYDKSVRSLESAMFNDNPLVMPDNMMMSHPQGGADGAMAFMQLNFGQAGPEVEQVIKGKELPENFESTHTANYIPGPKKASRTKSVDTDNESGDEMPQLVDLAGEKESKAESVFLRGIPITANLKFDLKGMNMNMKAPTFNMTSAQFNAKMNESVARVTAPITRMAPKRTKSGEAMIPTVGGTSTSQAISAMKNFVDTARRKVDNNNFYESSAMLHSNLKDDDSLSIGDLDDEET